MSKVLKRLYLGDVVKQFGTKQLRKLTTEEPTDSIVGTWVFNTSLNNSGTSSSLTYDIDIVYLSVARDTFYIPSATSSAQCVQFYRSGEGGYGCYFYINASNQFSLYAYKVRYSVGGDGHTNVSASEQYRTFDIVGGDDVNNFEFIKWLKANATKQ